MWDLGLLERRGQLFGLQGRKKFKLSPGPSIINIRDGIHFSIEKVLGKSNWNLLLNYEGNKGRTLVMDIYDEMLQLVNQYNPEYDLTIDELDLFLQDLNKVIQKYFHERKNFWDLSELENEILGFIARIRETYELENEG